MKTTHSPSLGSSRPWVKFTALRLPGRMNAGIPRMTVASLFLSILPTSMNDGSISVLLLRAASLAHCITDPVLISLYAPFYFIHSLPNSHWLHKLFLQHGWSVVFLTASVNIQDLQGCSWTCILLAHKPEPAAPPAVCGRCLSAHSEPRPSGERCGTVGKLPLGKLIFHPECLGSSLTSTFQSSTLLMHL